MTIVRPYRAAKFVLQADTYKAPRAIFAPRSRAVKKPYGASLKFAFLPFSSKAEF